MLAEKFIERLERQGLLEEKVIAELRNQIADSRFVITPEAVAKLLVDNGHLTTFQARKLVGELMDEAETDADRAAKATAKASAAPASRPAKPAAPQSSPEDDELGLLPFDGDGSPPPAPAKPAPMRCRTYRQSRRRCPATRRPRGAG